MEAKNLGAHCVRDLGNKGGTSPDKRHGAGGWLIQLDSSAFTGRRGGGGAGITAER